MLSLLQACFGLGKLQTKKARVLSDVTGKLVPVSETPQGCPPCIGLAVRTLARLLHASGLEYNKMTYGCCAEACSCNQACLMAR